MKNAKSFQCFESVTGRWIAKALLICLHIGLSGAALGQAGIVAWKDQSSHAETPAKVFYFERMEQNGSMTWFFRERQRIVLEPKQAFEVVLLPGSIEELKSKSGAVQLKKDHAELLAFAVKYPAAGTLLEKRLEQMSQYLSSPKEGGVNPSSVTVSVAKENTAGAISNTPSKTQAIYPIEIFVVCAVYLLLLLAFTLWRKRTPVLLLLVLPFIAGFGWMTYKEQGLGWIQRVTEELRVAYQKLEWPSK